MIITKASFTVYVVIGAALAVMDKLGFEFWPLN